MISENKFFTSEINADGIALISLDMKDYPTNLFTFEFLPVYLGEVNALLSKDEVKGLILTSARKDFVAGANVGELQAISDNSEAIFQKLMQLHKGVLANEALKKPMVSIINGHALGGGYELALTTHHRIAVQGNYRIGLPEASLGLFPGGGGTIKLAKMLGIEKAVTILLQGLTFNPDNALKSNLVHELAETTGTALEQAKTWILTHPEAIQPWGEKSKIPGGGINSPGGYMAMTGSIGNLRKKTHGNYPGLNYCLAAIHDGVDLPIDRALEVEARYFVKTLSSKEAKSMIRTNFFGINDAKKGKNKPQGFEPNKIKKLGILGAGMMGAGIAYSSAKVGIEVVLKDTTIENAEKGKAYSRKLMDGLLNKGKTTSEKASKLLELIKPTATYEDLKDCDLIIEAVFEEPGLKSVVTKESEPFLNKDGFFASNTSTLPITKLAQASIHPEKFIGIHFFSPVDKMPLIEIIVGKETSKETLARAIDYATQIGKVPIVVNDSQGFFTSRVFGKYNLEAVTMLLEGVNPILIENVAKKAGFAVGPLAVMDEVSQELLLYVFRQNPKRLPAEEKMFALIQKMVDDGRKGKKVGKGFYDYPENGKKTIWNNEFITVKDNVVSPEDIHKRLMHLEALDSYRCLEEGVLNTTMDGDIGSVLGLGFPPQTGGVFSYIDQVGLKTFVEDCKRFQPYGEQWEVPESLVKLAEEGFTFYSGLKQNWKKQ